MQYGIGTKGTHGLSPGSTNRGVKNSGGVLKISAPKPSEKGFYGEDEDSETSMFFNSLSYRTDKDVRSFTGEGFHSSLYYNRPDKELVQSPSPSQLSGLGNVIYGQPGITSLGLSQRSLGGQRNSTPTTSGMSSFNPMSLHQQQSSPNRSIMSTTVGQRNFMNQVPSSQSLSNFQKRTNALSSSSGLFPAVSAYANSRGGDTTNLDMNEFPTLGNRIPLPNPSTFNVRNYVNMVSKPASEQPEFSIQQEDFPALPGSTNPPSSNSTDFITKTSGSSLSGYESVVKDGKLFNDKGNKNPNKRTIQTHPDGTVSNIPVGMVTDQFGMVGLLTFIKAAETDDKLAAFAPGIDLTTLGLNLNSPENLYSTFQSPWADAPCRPQDIDYHVPSEYLTNIYIRDKLAPMKLNRYGEDLLFFLFCMNGGDVLQLAAAVELYNRDWRYHKEERVWITRAPGVEPPVQTSLYERGTYYYFDVQNWRRNAKEFHLEYEKLEDKPHLPGSSSSSGHASMANHTILGH